VRLTKSHPLESKGKPEMNGKVARQEATEKTEKDTKRKAAKHLKETEAPTT
jgi:hypothetical protein